MKKFKNLSKENVLVENKRMKFLKLKNRVTRIYSSVQFNIRIKASEERITELKDKTTESLEETTQSEQ